MKATLLARSLIPVLALSLIVLPLPAGQDPCSGPRLVFTALPASASLLSAAELASLLPPATSGPSGSPALSLTPRASFASPAAFAPRPLSAAAQAERVLFTGTLISLIGLNIADSLVTRKVVRSLGPEELTPLGQAFAESDMALIAFKFGSTYLNIVALRAIHRSNKPLAWALSLVSNFLVGTALAVSLEQLEGVRNGPAAQR
ncbi:MAG: hypothetical protein JW747_09310 [Candidatus Aminicenantes bacterium]|nr:hypothetical protein [Candidatus Aminicenantes bacterium]